MGFNCEKLCADAIADLISEGLIAIDADSKITYLNEVATQIMGQIAPDFHAAPADLFFGRRLTDFNAFTTNRPFVLACSYVLQNGGLQKVTGSLNHLAFELLVRKQELGAIIVLRDITNEQLARQNEQRLNRELHAINSCMQALIGAEEENKLLTEICNIICDQAGYRMAWVAYASQDEDKSVIPVAWAGHEDGYLKNLNVSWADNERGQGPTGIAIRTNAKSYCVNFASDPGVAIWRDAALQRGYRSSIVLPLRSEQGRAFGSLNIYSTEPEKFNSDEVRILEQFASDLSFGINVLRGRAERKRAQEELHKAKEEARQSAISASLAKSAFLANMSHEIRTPLSAILGFSELITAIESTEDERREYSKAIRRNGKILSNIIDDILDLSKVEAGKLEVNLEQEVRLAEILSDISRTLAARAEEKGISFSIVCEGATPFMIRTDPFRLTQILFNIVGNAIKFTHAGSVSLTVKPHGSRGLSFAVRDSGVGIAPHDREQLFAPFYQVDESIRRRFGGSGLGLALSRRLAELLGGTIELTDSTPGEGSVFTLQLFECLPITNIPLSPHSPSAPHKSRDLKPLKGLSFLLVEDSAEMQILTSSLLRNHGAASIIPADHGQAALDELAQGETFDIILMDLQMPVLDGYETVRILRSRGVTTPIIAMTAHAMKEERERCLESGFDEHVSKPIDLERFIEIILRLKKEIEH